MNVNEFERKTPIAHIYKFIHNESLTCHTTTRIMPAAERHGSFNPFGVNDSNRGLIHIEFL